MVFVAFAVLLLASTYFAFGWLPGMPVPKTITVYPEDYLPSLRGSMDPLVSP